MISPIIDLSHFTNVGAGQGLLKVGSSLVPFINKFPRNTELYRLMTTKFGEVKKRGLDSVRVEF